MDKFITLTVTISEDSFDYLYKYSKRMGFDINTAIDSLILFDETPIHIRDKESDVSNEKKSERNRCRLFIAEMIKGGDKQTKDVMKSSISVGFSRSQIQRSMDDVSSYYYRDGRSFRRLKVDIESLRTPIEETVACSVCGDLVNTPSRKLAMCDRCKSEYRRVLVNNSRARKMGLTCDLTIAEWFGVIRDSEFKCVYCGGAFEEMDHIIQLEDGGGTTASNVAPSCKRCNLEKKKV